MSLSPRSPVSTVAALAALTVLSGCASLPQGATTAPAEAPKAAELKPEADRKSVV